jgi:outer membrane protein TolC
LKDDGNIRNYQARLESWRRFLQNDTGHDVSQIDDDSFPLGMPAKPLLIHARAYTANADIAEATAANNW